MIEIKTLGLIFFSFSLLHGFVAALNCTSPGPESLFDALERELFPRKLLRPVKRFSDTLNVSITITVVGILELNEKTQALTMFILQVLEWDIAGLSWDEEECGTTRVSVPREKLWIPDVQIREFVHEDESPQTSSVYLYNTGHVYDDKPIRVVATCKFVIYTFPFDIQNCSLTFKPYLHVAADVRMIQSTTAAEILEESRQVMQIKGEWELVDIKSAPINLKMTNGSNTGVKYHRFQSAEEFIHFIDKPGGYTPGIMIKESVTRHYSHVGRIILRRRPLLYVVNLLIPSCFLITVDLFSFLLPPHSVDRSSFKMTLILGYTVFLLIMNDLLPVTGNATPLMSVFFSVSLALMVASLLETVLITNIQFSSSQYSAAPRWLSVLVLRYLAVIVCLPPIKKSNRVTVSLHPPAAAMSPIIISSRDLPSVSGDTPPANTPPVPALDQLRKLSKDLTAIRLQIDKHFQGNSASQEWQMIGAVIDRFLFGLYLVFILACFVTIVCIWIWSQAHVG